MPLLRVAQAVFALCFLSAVAGFVFFLRQWEEVRDEPLEFWNTGKTLEVELGEGRHHLWLVQEPAGEERAKSFQEFWQEGWQLSGTYLDEAGEPSPERLLITPSNGQESWPEDEADEGRFAELAGAEQLVQVGFFTTTEPSRIRLQARSVRESIQASPAQILLSKSSIAKQHRLSFWMLLWLAGGILVSVLAFFVISSFLPRSFLRSGGQASSQAKDSNSRSTSS